MDSKVLEAILQLYAKHDESQGQLESEFEALNQVALATIISTAGSTPRKAGAQVLFFRDGRTIGTIGGGCGEAEVRQRAFRIIEQGQPEIVDVNLTNEVVENDGMVCGGIMKVFVEPLKLNLEGEGKRA